MAHVVSGGAIAVGFLQNGTWSKACYVIRAMKKIAALLMLAGAFAQSASAVPLLQLDIGGGLYVAAVEGTVAQTPEFDLYALLNAGKQQFDGNYERDYFLSVAIAPRTPVVPVGGIGTVKVDGVSYSFANSDYGHPDGIPPQGVFDTLYREISFKFIDAPAYRAVKYNVQNLPNVDPVPDPTGVLRFTKFAIDVTDLNPDYYLIFDLYNKNQNGAVDQFAPFSHDAESGHRIPDNGGTLALLVVGLAGLGLACWRRLRQR